MQSAKRAGRSWPVSVIVGVLAAFASIGRLWLFDRSAPSQVLWAEDGLFTLCIQKADFWTCLTDPFAGYLLFLPRVLVWPISLLPWEYWAIAANVVAAVFAGVISAFAVIILRRFGAGWFVSILVALLPVITPMVGLEAINAIGSSYMLLLFLATLLVVLPPAAHASRNSLSYLYVGLVFLFITALTMPSAVVIVVLIAIMLAKNAWPARTCVAWLMALGAGLAAQFFVALNAEVPRQVNLGVDTLNSWADSIPVSLLTYWPGLSLGRYEFFSNFTLSPVGITGWLVTGVLIAAGLLLVTRRDARTSSIGLLILAGLGFGLIPSAIGDANNRYFVVPLLLWAVAVLISLDPRIRRTRTPILIVITALIALIWWPAIPASAFRATPAPAWGDEVARIEARCISEPDAVERPMFTPFWPPNWGDGLTEPTHPSLSCPIVWRWAN